MKLFYSTCAFLILAAIAPSAFSQTGNVGIGTTNPAYPLDVHSSGNAQFNLVEGIGGRTALFSRYTNRLEIQPSDAFEISLGGIDKRNLYIAPNGFVGVNTATPTTQFQVLTVDGAYGMLHTNGTVALGTYIGDNAGWIGTSTNHPLYFFTNNGSPAMTLSTNGNFGIGTTAPASGLQIGSLGSTGYNGFALAFGSPDATQASGIAQTSSVAEWNSTTTIALMPNGNGHGRVGINTISPGYPLEVDDEVLINPYFASTYSDGGPGNCPGGCQINVSIFANGNVLATEFDASSDARIKDIGGVTDNEKDLRTLNEIEVTDYTMKDKLKNGNKPFKKVIAQQVEQVYPQVINKGVNYIPNVYQLTSRIEKTPNGYLLTFKNKHHISAGAKKLQLIGKDSRKQEHDIIAIPSEYHVLVHSLSITDNQVFVYGEQVNDFRTVDYDGLTTLNISATQELSRLIKHQQEEIEKLNEKLTAMEKKISEPGNKN